MLAQVTVVPEVVWGLLIFGLDFQFSVHAVDNLQRLTLMDAEKPFATDVGGVGGSALASLSVGLKGGSIVEVVGRSARRGR